MSHWTKAKVTLKDLYSLKKVAEKNGIKVEVAKKKESLTFSSNYAGNLPATMIFEKNGGTAGICKQAKGSDHELIMDNFSNPLASEFGHDCKKLMQQYTEEIVNQQMMIMGGSLAERRVLEDGSIELHIGLAS